MTIEEMDALLFEYPENTVLPASPHRSQLGFLDQQERGDEVRGPYWAMNCVARGWGRRG